MRKLSLVAALFLFISSNLAHSQAPTPLTAEAIMARVAANQDRSEQLRTQYIYRQHIHVASRKTNGKLMREETADYDVLPDPSGSKKELKKLDGRYLEKGKYVAYSTEAVSNQDGLDAGLVNGFRTDLTNEKSKDGMGKDLFPLTSSEQAKYSFQLVGEQTLNGRSVYHLSFRPKVKHERKGDDDADWAGGAFIDKEDFEPVNVYTKLAERIPLFVRTVFGTDVPGLGFSVTYKRQPDGVWFPSSFGTEFRIHAVFFINRVVTVSLQNTDFQHTHVDSKITSVGAIQ
jgi:hypothetical protein